MAPSQTQPSPLESLRPAQLSPEHYEPLRELLEEADRYTRRLEEAYPGETTCKAGCSVCCRTIFDVSLLEGFYLAYGLEQLEPGLRSSLLSKVPDRVQRIAATRDLDAPSGKVTSPFLKELDEAVAASLPGAPCPLLDEGGGCAIYPWRPLVCRYHGHAYLRPDAPGGQDYCYLNYRGLRARGEEPDPALAMPLKDLRQRRDALNRAFVEEVFGMKRVFWVAPIAEYAHDREMRVGDWRGRLHPLDDEVRVAVRRFFEVLGARSEARRVAVDPQAPERSREWAEVHMGDPQLCDKLDLVIDSCMARLSGEAIDGRQIAGILRSSGRKFRRHAQLLATQVALEAAGRR